MTETPIQILARRTARQAQLKNPGLVVLTFDEARALLAESCPDHEACSICEAVYCDTCEIGDTVACADSPAFVRHCPDCAHECRVCRTEMQADSDFTYAREMGVYR